VERSQFFLEPKVTIPFISNSLPNLYENKNSVKKYIPSRINIMIRKSLHLILIIKLYGNLTIHNISGNKTWLRY